MPLTQAELARVRWQLALEESERKKAAEQSKPTFLRWLGSVGLILQTKSSPWCGQRSSWRSACRSEHRFYCQ
jgi:hypothetical protein